MAPLDCSATSSDPGPRFSSTGSMITGVLVCDTLAALLDLDAMRPLLSGMPATFCFRVAFFRTDFFRGKCRSPVEEDRINKNWEILHILSEITPNC